MKIEKISTTQIVCNEWNPNKMNDSQQRALNESLEEFGDILPLVVRKVEDNCYQIIDGQHRFESLQNSPEIDCVVIDVSETQAMRLTQILNRTRGEDDPEKLLHLLENLSSQISIEELIHGMPISSEAEFDELLSNLQAGLPQDEEEDFGGGLTDDDEVPDEVETRVKRGDIWELGRHRIMCGDSTVAEDVAALMDGKKAILLHADPPYGMGKEKDGVENDNLYREKLDAFQIQWYKAFRSYLEDNASVYIWGNAEDLWRLWYAGGLKTIERSTFRNEIIWNKGDCQGINNESFRMFPPASERCLFFMLGEQCFNINADNYWDGWEPIRVYLKTERDKMKWDNAKCKSLAGHSPKSGCHWFDSSQWSFVTEDVYKSWQKAAKGEAFKQEYDELKQKFYSTRAYFDNIHENMTDVWNYPKVEGEERHGHATPKPVDMICRVLKTSSPPASLTIEPFLGSGSTLIAAEKTDRICYGMELSEHYCDVIIKRWEDYTGDVAIKL